MPFLYDLYFFILSLPAGVKYNSLGTLYVTIWHNTSRLDIKTNSTNKNKRVVKIEIQPLFFIIFTCFT